MRPPARWLVVALYVNAIFWTIPYQRSLARAALGPELGRRTLAAVGIAFALGVIGLALFSRRRTAKRRHREADTAGAVAGGCSVAAGGAGSRTPGPVAGGRSLPAGGAGSRVPGPVAGGRSLPAGGAGSRVPGPIAGGCSAAAARDRSGAVAAGPSLPAVAACVLAYGGLVWYLSGVPDEVVHLAEYGVLAVLLWWALSGAGVARAPWLAVAAAAGIGLVDEMVQGATPERFFDWRDVFANFASGLLPVWLLRGGGRRWSIS